MPCTSRIYTNFDDHTKLAEALRMLGFEIIEETETRVWGEKGRRKLDFTRYSKRESFDLARNGAAALAEVGTKYAEIGVRRWAKQRGFSVIKHEGNKMRLVNRRG